MQLSDNYMSAYEGSKMQERDEDNKKKQFFTHKDIQDRINNLPKDIVREDGLKQTRSDAKPDPAQEKTPRELTFGGKAVMLTINFGGNEAVIMVKELFANVIDDLNFKREHTTSGEKKRMYSVAITEATTACKWAIDAILYPY